MQLDFNGIIGHRGLAAFAPENTLASINLAATRGLKWVEVDVNITRDAVPVLCHDSTLNRTTNGKGRLSSFNYAELSQLDAGSWFGAQFNQQKIPSLLQALELCQQLALGLNVELKPDPGINHLQISHFVSAVNQVLLPFKNRIPLLVSSFNKIVMKAFKKQVDSIALGFLLDKRETEHSLKAFANEINCYSFHLSHRQCRRFKHFLLTHFDQKLLVYTINSPVQAQTLLKNNITAVFSDTLTPDSLSLPALSH